MKLFSSLSVDKNHAKLKKETIKNARIPGEIIHSDKESEIIWDIAYASIKTNGFALEVGSWKGNSSFIIATVCALRHAQLICVDSFNGNMLYGGLRQDNSFFRDNILKHLEGLPVSYMIMDSREAHKVLADRSFDFCFVDGDHSEPVVSQDIKNYYKKVKKGGMYSGHDYGFVHSDPNVIYTVKKNVDKVCGKVKVRETIWIKHI